MANNKNLFVSPAHQAILTTILYSDIFSFPPNKDELWRFLIADTKISRAAFARGLETMQPYITQRDGYYCLKKRETIITRRISNRPVTAEKREKARMVAEKLAQIPSILFIGISGGLGAGNVTKKDDIDFFFIVKKNTLFVSRLVIFLVLSFMGIRRRRLQKDTADTICVNLLIDETALTWFADRQDLYTAREIAQIVPLFERENIYASFVKANIWINRFLPHYRAPLRFSSIVISNKSYVQRLFVTGISVVVFNFFAESCFRYLQMSWMNRHRTKEVVTKHVLAFHPNDYRSKTLAQLRLKMRQFGLLTKI